MKIKDLIFNREKLRKYDELKEWKERFEQPSESKINLAHSEMHYECGVMKFERDTYELPDHIKQIIISAIDAEIAKLDEE